METEKVAFQSLKDSQDKLHSDLELLNLLLTEAGAKITPGVDLLLDEQVVATRSLLRRLINFGQIQLDQLNQLYLQELLDRQARIDRMVQLAGDDPLSKQIIDSHQRQLSQLFNLTTTHPRLRAYLEENLNGHQALAEKLKLIWQPSFNFLPLPEENSFPDIVTNLQDHSEIKNLLGSLPWGSKNLLKLFLFSASGKQILTRMYEFIHQNPTDEDNFNKSLAGAIFEQLAYQHIRSTHESNKLIVLSPQEVFYLYHNLYPGLPVIDNGGFGLNFGIGLVSFPDGFIIREDGDRWIIDGVIEYKSSKDSRFLNDRFNRQVEAFKFDQLSRDLKIAQTNKESPDRLFLGEIIKKLRPDLTSRPVIINPRLELILGVPENSNLTVPDSVPETIPFLSQDLSRLITVFKKALLPETSLPTPQTNAKKEIPETLRELTQKIRPHLPHLRLGLDDSLTTKVISFERTPRESLMAKVELDSIGVDGEILSAWRVVQKKGLSGIITFREAKQHFPEIRSEAAQLVLSKLNLAHLGDQAEFDHDFLVGLLASCKVGFSLTINGLKEMPTRAQMLRPPKN